MTVKACRYKGTSETVYGYLIIFYLIRVKLNSSCWRYFIKPKTKCHKCFKTDTCINKSVSTQSKRII